MEMPAETKTKTSTATATKRARTRAKTRARARTQAPFKTATGNGNSYTRNINAAENYTDYRKILFFKQNSAENQHNKTKIKRKRNHLKFLIYLYFKLILCISHINKTILKIFKIKNSYTNTNSQNCIIKLQQEKAVYLTNISLQIVIKILARLHYCRRKSRINYVQLIIRHFVGICLKRLISFKRLQQIPESSKYITLIRAGGHRKEKPETDKEKLKENFKDLRNWQEEQLQNNSKYKYLTCAYKKQQFSRLAQKNTTQVVHEDRKVLEQNVADFEIKNFNKAHDEVKSQKAISIIYKKHFGEFECRAEEKMEKICIPQTQTKFNYLNLKFHILSHSFLTKCSQLYIRKINCQLITFFNGILISNMIPKVQKNSCSNKKNFRKILWQLHRKRCQLRAVFKHKNSITKPINTLEFTQQELSHGQKIIKHCLSCKCCHVVKNNFVGLQDYRDVDKQISLKYCQPVTSEIFYGHKIQAEKISGNYYKRSAILKSIIIQPCSANSPQHHKQVIHFVLNLKSLRTKFQATLKKNAGSHAKERNSEFSLNPIRKYCQLSNFKALQENIGNTYEINKEFGPKFTKDTPKVQIETILTEFLLNSPLKWGQLANNTVVFKHDTEKYVQLETYLEEELSATYQKSIGQIEAEPQTWQKYSPISPQMCDQLRIIVLLKEYISKAKQQWFTIFCYGKLIHFWPKSSPKCCQLKVFMYLFHLNIRNVKETTLQNSLNNEEIVKPIQNKGEIDFSSCQCCPFSKQTKNFSRTTLMEYEVKYFINKEQKVETFWRKMSLNSVKHNVSLKTLKQEAIFRAEVKSNLPQLSCTYIIAMLQKLKHFIKFDQGAALKHFSTLLAEQRSNKTIFSITDKQSTFHQNQQPNFNQELCIENGLQKQSSLYFINGEVGKVKLKLAFKANIVRHSQSVDNNNSYQVKSKHQAFLKKCQHILCATLLSCFCCLCCWHINGFPLVLVKILKYLKDATVHVLTRRLQTATNAATAKSYYDGNKKTACDDKLKKFTEVLDYKGNQQNVFKRQHTHRTTAIATATATSYSYSSSCYSTKSLTASSSFCKSLKNLILLKKTTQKQFQARQQVSTYCRYHQYRHHYYHNHHNRHDYQHTQETKSEQTQQQQEQQQQQQHHQLYNCNSTVHLQLPSSLVFSRTLIILILLSSLWHTSEGFHGSSVKLSANTVKTKYGLVRGIVVRSSPSLVEAYLGIPYASPPVGSLRFMPPITPSTWKTVRNADRFSPVCPQNVPIPPNGPEALLEVPRARLAQLRRLLPLLSNQSEDCLYLNIYVPYENRRHRRFTELKDAPKLPTILFIHGESYEWNSGNPYDGSELAAHGNVIVVTINFRLGILGFLKTGGKESAQGNFGLMDLVAGLHWLKENLPAFGGDPQQITLLGHGTGAALANILVVSPVASDLIQHTVMVSGSALSPWAIQKNPLFVKRRVAEQTGCHGDMLYYDLAPCLRTKTVTELLAVKIDHPRFLVGFAPFIDGTVISPNTNSIGKLSLPLGSAIVSTSGIEFANFPKRNLIFCLTSVESHLDLNAQDLEFGFNETRRDRILRTYVRNNFHYHLNEIFAVLKNEYTDWDQAIRSPLSSRDATLQFLSDGHTASSLIKLGYMHSLRGGKGYFLHFKHRTVEEEYPQRTGSVRGEDMPFWLGLPISPLFPHNYTTQEKQISRLMLRYLANFAKTGNPNQSSLPLSQPSALSLISSATPLSTSASSPTANDALEKIKRSSFNIINATALTSSGPNKSHHIIEDVATAAAREALNLAVLYNQRRTKRTYYKRHSRSNDDHSGSASSEVNYFLSNNNNDNSFSKLDGSVLPFWDAYDVVNQLYMELGSKAEIQSHYRGHKLSMWLNLIPQLHRHANMNDQSMRHHQFQDDLNNLNLYEGIVRAQLQTKPDDDDETLLLPRSRPTSPPTVQETNGTERPPGGTTECGVDGAMFVAEMTTVPPPNENHSLVLDSREKEMATASTGIMRNLEVLRRLSGKQFPSYTTALIATVLVGCFLFILNILIFAGIYHQREKRARDAKTKEELQDNDTSKNSSMLKLNALGSETGSFNGSGAGVSGKTTVVFGEYSCYDEKSLQTKDEKLIVELPPKQMVDANWAGCSTSTLDLLKTKHHTPLDTNYTLGNLVPINTETQTEHLMPANSLEMATYNPLPMATGLIIDPSFAATSSTGLLSKRSSFVGSAGQLNQYDFASVQSSDQMSFKDIENAVKASATMNDDITQDDDIPEPPPPPKSFQSMQQHQQQAAATPAAATACGTSGGGILRQAGTTSATQTGGGKKRVHIQEISV